MINKSIQLPPPFLLVITFPHLDLLDYLVPVKTFHPVLLLTSISSSPLSKCVECIGTPQYIEFTPSPPKRPSQLKRSVTSLPLENAVSFHETAAPCIINRRGLSSVNHHLVGQRDQLYTYLLFPEIK